MQLKIIVTSETLQQLLEESADFFQELTGLPPSRQYDHQINLKPGSKPVSL